MPATILLVTRSLRKKWLTIATNMGSMCTNMTLLATVVKLRLVIHDAKWMASTTPMPMRPANPLAPMLLNFLIPSK